MQNDGRAGEGQQAAGAPGWLGRLVDGEASAWVLALPGARLTLLLSPGPYRGFSGEGGLLATLTAATAEDAAARLLEHLAWEPVIDHVALMAATGLGRVDLDAGIAFLAATGKVGHDLATGTWFHRELPWDAERVERDNPRLRDARRLVAEGAVSTTSGIGSGRRRPFSSGSPRCIFWNSTPVALPRASVMIRTGAAWKMTVAPSSMAIS